GAARTIDPDVDFEFEEECTVTIEAANVADLDGTIDPMPANHRFAFVVAAAPVDVAPSVDSIVPAAGATNVSTNANIVVKFTEPVTTSAAAFALSCGGSAHPFTLSGGPDTYTLDPDVDFDEVESCELVIDAEQVFDQDGAIDSMVADFLASFTTRAGAGDYYSGVDDSSCVALRATLHALIDDHVVYPYSSSSTDTWDILESADEDPLDASKVLDIYRNRSYTKVDCRTGVSSSCATGDANRYNREHTWPNSLGFGSDTLGGLPNPPYTDTHMLYVSAVDYNSNRGNKPYATCSTTSTCSSPENATDAYGGFGGGSGTYPGNSNWNLAGGYEVWNHRRGDAARAIFYMAVRYDGGTHGGTGQVEPDLEITDTSSLISTTPTGGKYYMGLRTTLLAWHEADAPDARESLRNDVVFSYQQNRNPFIDHPEWVEIAFADPCTGTAPTNQPPVLSDVAVSVLENAANGTTLTTLVASDPNAGQALTYSIQAGNASGAFAINAGTGAITVANAALVDRAVAASYALTVRATDNGTPAMSDDATLSITITQVNDAPSFTKGADAAVDEDAGSQAIANWATAISAGPSDESSQTVAFEVTGNTNTPLFAVAPAIAANGTLSFTPAANANGSATISFRARDSGGTANGGVDASGVQTLVVTVTPVNDAPTAGNANGAVVAGSAIGTQVATVTGTDVEGDTLAYAITSGNTGGAFAIDPATGAITVANSAAVTEAASPFALTITLTDDGTPARSGTATVTVSVTAAPPDALFAHGFE
ncbi:MAG TPA: endonuclease, partial [Xanthomonadales bacterium]|nr:endonuclease [Xanthomonadales bacterium]